MGQYSFEAYNNLSPEELRIRRDFLYKEAIEEEKIIDDEHAPSYQKRAAQSDLKLIRECLLYIEELLSERERKTR